MSEEMFVKNFFTVVLPIVGVLVIFLAIILRERLVGKGEINLGSGEKLGGIVLKADAFGLSLLVGFLFAGFGFFVSFKNYEDRLATLQRQYEGLREAMAEFKVFDERLSLKFPDKDPPNPTKITSFAAYVQRRGDREEKLYDWASVEKGAGGVVVTFSKLGLGDKLHVTVEEQGRKWKSDDYSTGAPLLNMNLMEQ
jgi:hypothetical protein